MSSILLDFYGKIIYMNAYTFIEIFSDLLAEHELNRKQFSEKSGIPYPTVIGWTTHNRLPDYTALIKIADFFDCSVDYLTGRQDYYGRDLYSGKISQQEKSLLVSFRKLSNENKNLIVNLSGKLSNKNKK